MNLNSKRSSSHSQKTDQRVDNVRFPSISNSREKKNAQRKRKAQEKRKNLTSRSMELSLDNHILETLRNHIYERLERQYKPASVATESPTRISRSDETYQHLQRSQDDDWFTKVYNDYGLRFDSQVEMESDEDSTLPSKRLQSSRNTNLLVPPFLLRLPHCLEKTGVEAELERRRDGFLEKPRRRAVDSIQQGSFDRGEGATKEDFKVKVIPGVASSAFSPTEGRRNKREEEEAVEEVEVERTLEKKLLEGDMSVEWKVDLPTISIYIHSTSETEYERTILMERVFPRLKEYGNQRGVALEIIDPQWGMDESVLEEHTCQELLTQMITRCYDNADRFGRYPYFVTFLTGTGSEVTSSIMPLTIPREEFDVIMKAMIAEHARLRREGKAPAKPRSHSLPSHKVLKREPEGVGGVEGVEGAETTSEQASAVAMETSERRVSVGEEKLSKDRPPAEVLKERIATLFGWYKVDENDDPAVYRLQKPSVLFPDVLSRNARIRTQARKSWSFVGRNVLQLLQDFATRTLKDAAALSKYFISLAEHEIDCFLSKHHTPDSPRSCIWFRPEVLGLTSGSAEDGSEEEEEEEKEEEKEEKENQEQEAISGPVSDPVPHSNPLTRRLEEALDRTILKTYSISNDPEAVAARGTRNLFPAYFDHVSSFVTDTFSDVISRAADVVAQGLSASEREIRTHLFNCQKNARCFVGRQVELTAIKRYVGSGGGGGGHPMVVFGKTGSGLTALISKAATEAQHWMRDRNSCTIVRLIGETMESQSGLSLLRSLILQLSSLDPNEESVDRDEPQDWEALLSGFKDCLERVAKLRTVIVFIDSLHELRVPSDCHRIEWIPKDLPPNVRFVISIADEEPTASLKRLRNWIPTTEGSGEIFLEVKEFLPSDITQVTHDWFSGRSSRRVTKSQTQMIEQCFEKCRSPLYVRLVLEEARRWASSMNRDEIKLRFTIKGIVLTNLGRLEKEYNDLLPRRVLGYLVTARYGVTQSELEDILSLDEPVMQEIHSLYRPALRRIPPLLLHRLLEDLKVFVKECHSEGFRTLRFSHPLFRDIVQERYIKDAKTNISFHKVLAEYFSNSWNSEERGFRKGMTQQPLYWELVPQNGTSVHPRLVFNSRRLDELPYHLVFSQQVEKLKELCFCNLEYLFSRMEQSPLGLQSLLNDIELSAKIEQGDGDLQLVLGALRASVPVLEEHPGELASQLVGRLLDIVALDKPATERDPERYPYVKAMLHQARQGSDSPSIRPTLIPSVTCLLQPTKATYKRLSGHRGPITALATSADGLLALTASQDDTLRFWDLATRRALGTITGVGSGVYDMCFAARNQVAVTSEHRLLRVWNLRTFECVEVLAGCDDPATLVAACDGTLLAALFHGSNHLRAWNLEGRATLIRDTNTTENWKPVHKNNSVILSKTALGATILYAFRDASFASAYDLKAGSVVRRLRIKESGCITAVAVSRTYFICAARYPETTESGLQDKVSLEVFDGDTGQHVRTIRSCGWDVLEDLYANAIGSHVLSICRKRKNATSYVAIWNVETQDHKHVARHSGESYLGAMGDLRYVLTATHGAMKVKVWDVKAAVESKTPKEKPRSGVARILTLRDFPQYIVACGSDGRKVEVWNVVMNDCCGSVVSCHEALTSPDDIVLIFNIVLVILTDKQRAKLQEGEESGEVLVYKTVKVYDLLKGQWRSEVKGCAIPVFGVEDYALLSEESLLGLSETRSCFIIWDVVSGSVSCCLKIPFRERDPTADSDSTWCDSPAPETGRTASSAKMTPWARRRETKSARKTRHRAEFEKERRRRQELQSERWNCVDRFLVSADHRTLVTSFFGHHLCVFDLEERKQTHVLRNDSSMMHLFASCLTGNGSYLAHVSYDEDEKEGRVTLWNLDSGNLEESLTYDRWINSIALSDSADRIVFCSQSKASSERSSLCIWEPSNPMQTLRELQGLRTFNVGIEAQLSLTSDAKRAVVCAGNVSIWDLDLGQLLCVFSPDAKIQCFGLALGGQLVTFGLHDTPNVITLKLVSSRSQDALKFPNTPCLFGEDPSETMEREFGYLDEDLSEKKIRINPSLFFQAADDG